MARKNFYVKESEMDDYQRKVIQRRSEGSLIVRGCAGSGKSVLAFWKLHDIVSNKKGSVQLIVYTKALREYFIQGCRGEGIDASLVDYYHNWNKHPKTTDYMIVDETQDFSESQIKQFLSHANKALLLYGDSSQQIYSFRKMKGDEAPVNMEDIHRITEFPMEQLVFNHRLPAKVARVAQALNAEYDDLEGRCREEGTELPYILKYPSRDDQLNAIVDIIKTRSFEDVGILVPKNEDVKVIADYLRSRGLNVESKYSERATNYSNLNFATSNPKVLTYHSAKGLQFEAVFLPECEARLAGNFLEPLYVAMTRTYQSLYIMYSEALPQQMDKIAVTDYSASLRSAETELL